MNVNLKAKDLKALRQDSHYLLGCRERAQLVVLKLATLLRARGMTKIRGKQEIVEYFET